MSFSCSASRRRVLKYGGLTPLGLQRPEGFCSKESRVRPPHSKHCLDNSCLNNYIPAMTSRLPRSATRRAHFDSLEQEVFLNVWRTYDRLRMLEDELFGQFDLTSQQYNVLRLLRAEHPEAVPTLTLAARLVSRAPDITRILDKLEERGLLSRERLADNRRVVQVRILEFGVVLLDEIAEPLERCHARQLGHMQSANLKELCSLLRDARGPHEDQSGPWH